MRSQPNNTKKPGKKTGEDDLSGLNHHHSTIAKTEIENAHAAGIGALGRSEENQIEKLNDDELGKNEDVY